MLNEETVSKRLRIMAGWVRGMRDGTLPSNARTTANMVTMLGECAGEVEQMEIAAGKADVTAQLRAAGGNVVALRAVLSNHALRKGVHHG